MFGNTELMSALIDGASDNEILNIINRSDVNRANNTNCSALHIATEFNRLFIVRCLIEAGANIDPINCHFYTPLMVAILFGFEDIAEELLKHGANPNYIEPKFNKSLLHCAISYNRNNMVKKLVEYGADINYDGGNFRTPLFYAKFRKNEEVVNYLTNLNPV